MAGAVLARFVSRSLLSASGPTGARIGGSTRLYWTPLRRTATALTSGGAAFLLGVPALSCLGYTAYHRVQVSAVVQALDRDEVLEQADYLYSCAETEKLYQLLLQYKDSDNAEFLWRLARASRDLSLLPDINPERKKQLVFESFEYAKKALEKDENCSAAHKWYGVCLGDVGEYGGVKVKIGNSYTIREHLERAVELNPKDATSFYILGFWCFSFAELPWYQRKVAAVIFSSPPTSTYEEALAFFLKAEEGKTQHTNEVTEEITEKAQILSSKTKDVDPNFYSKNLLMLGKTYLAMNDKQKALYWLTKSKEYPPHTLEDKEVHKEAAELLKKLG